MDDLTAHRCWRGVHFRKARVVDSCLASLQLCKLFSLGSTFRKECRHGRFYSTTKTADFTAECLTSHSRLGTLFTNAAPSCYVVEGWG